MIKKRNILTAIAVFAFINIVFFIVPSNAYAITLQELGDRIQGLSSQEEALIEDIIAVETQVNTKRNEIQELNYQLENFEIQLLELYRERDRILNKIEEIKIQLSNRAVHSYKYGNNDVAKMMISAKDINEVFTSIYFFRSIMKKDTELIQELRSEKENYEMIFRSAEEKKNEIQQLNNKIMEEEARLSEYLAKQKDLLVQVKSEKSEVKILLSEIEKRIREIQPPGMTLIGEWEMTATAYFSGGGGINGNGITALGLRARKGIVAVDPRVVPLGTRLYIPGYGEAFAGDTGGRVKGNKIDLAYDTLEECYRFGRRKIRVYLVQE
jgi:3D (Asp-Asp-Asp) domain-containing protein/peptidoglycan hydrolase CwlO-like protein